MNHLAIMRNPWMQYLKKGTKTIESRISMRKIAPKISFIISYSTSEGYTMTELHEDRWVCRDCKGDSCVEFSEGKPTQCMIGAVPHWRPYPMRRAN